MGKRICFLLFYLFVLLFSFPIIALAFGIQNIFALAIPTAMGAGFGYYAGFGDGSDWSKEIIKKEKRTKKTKIIQFTGKRMQ